ncbi:uncharacterized protein LODBEIA_P42010 [Lodderomyces beijingensis]|uniref:Pre-mRNA-processing protein 45 n=1 Tax=Lodderomyces beijingensis TaxID=1775926 RepID=A0ABP0ZUK9_9ASCO
MLTTLLPKPKHAEYISPEPILSRITTTHHHPNHHQKNTQILTTSKLTETHHTQYDSTIPLKRRFPNLIHNFPRPEPDHDVIEATKRTFELKLSPPAPSPHKAGTTYVANDGRTKIYTEDPMLPPKHKLSKNRHERPSAPTPILKIDDASSGAKLSKEERAQWDVPAAISNWKNNHGFVIGLDKRMMGSKRVREVEAEEEDKAGEEMINVEKLSALNRALNDADATARREIQVRNEMRAERDRLEAEERQARIREIARRNKRRRY